jgi:hypothetical protein
MQYVWGDQNVYEILVTTSEQNLFEDPRVNERL